jgi:voltage-gated potassium channel Kch
MNDSESALRSNASPMPVTEWTLWIAFVLSRKLSIEEWLYQYFVKRMPRSMFIEYLVVGRLGIVVIFLYGIPIISRFSLPASFSWMIPSSVFLSMGYIWMNTLSTLIRIQLLDRMTQIASTNHARTLILTLFNIPIMATAFAACFLVMMESARPAQAAESPFIGAGMAKKVEQTAHPDKPGETMTVEFIVATPVDMLYLSFVTFATIGYGDITPNTGLAKILIMIEIMSSVIILGMIVAMAIGLLSERTESDQQEFYARAWDAQQAQLELFQSHRIAMTSAERTSAAVCFYIISGIWIMAGFEIVIVQWLI